MTMTKTERNELRGIVRTQFKVLRAEVVQRQAEVLAEIEQEIEKRYVGEDRRRQAVMDRLGEIVGAASREATDVLKAEEVGVSISRPIRVWHENIEWPKDDRISLRRQALAAFEAKVAAAKLALDRQEADLLRKLAVGALDSDEAKSFLEGIPTVGELVPVSRLQELVGDLPEVAP